MLPKINQKFQAYYAPALATKSLWRLFFGLIIIILVYFAPPFFIGLGVVILAGPEEGPILLHMITQGKDPESVITILVTFIFMFLGVFVAVTLIHERGLKSLLGPDMKSVLRNFTIAFAVVVALMIISLPLFYFFEPPVRNMQLTTWLFWMMFGLPLLLLQVSSEELIFRGYFQQQLAARFNSRWAWYFLPSVAFGMLHYDPENMGSNAWLVVAHTTLFGLIAAEATARTGNLGAAIGLHFANNIFALTVVALDGPLSGLGLYKTAVHVSDETAIRSLLMYDFIFMSLLYGLFLLWCKKRPQL